MKKILVIEDENGIRDTLKDIISENGYDVITACNGQEGLQIIKEFGLKISLIISDILMPKKDGYEVLETIRNDNKLLLIPFIFLTGKRDYESIRNGMMLGADDYIAKPFKAKELLNAMALRIGKAEMIISHQIKKATEEKTKEIGNDRVMLMKMNSGITSGIRYAKRIQDSLLPNEELLSSEFKNHFLFHKSKNIASGDTYLWFSVLGRKILVIIDCTGHGVPGALLSVGAHSIFNYVIFENTTTNPADILHAADYLFRKTFNKNGKDGVFDGMDVAVCSIDQKNRVIEYSGAGRPLILICPINEREKEIEFSSVVKNENAKLFYLRGNSVSIDGQQTAKQFTNHRLTYEKGDCLYLFTDGYLDQLGGENQKKYGIMRLRNLLLSIYQFPMIRQRQEIQRVHSDWKRKNFQTDDILILGIQL